MVEERPTQYCRGLQIHKYGSRDANASATQLRVFESTSRFVASKAVSEAEREATEHLAYVRRNAYSACSKRHHDFGEKEAVAESRRAYL